MIRFSVNEDKDELIHLWREVFGDELEAINLFFDYHFKPENTVVYDDNGKIASMFYLLEGNFVISGEAHPSYYLYAAATDENYRGRGIMGNMLKFAEDTAASRGKDYICLLPAEDSLYGYYSKHGFKTVFRKKTVKIKNINQHLIDISADNELNFEKSRKDFFAPFDRFDWDKNAIEYAIKQNEFYGGNFQKSCNGYYLYSVNNGETVVKETTLQPLSELLFETEYAKVTVPVDFTTDCLESEITDNGMALPINKNAAEKLEYAKNAYLGLTLD